MFALIKSDIRAIYGVVNIKSLLKSILNPSVHASVLIRFATSKNKFGYVYVLTPDGLATAPRSPRPS